MEQNAFDSSCLGNLSHSIHASFLVLITEDVKLLREMHKRKESKYDKDNSLFIEQWNMLTGGILMQLKNYLNKLKDNCLALIYSAVQEFKLNSFLTTSEGGISSM